MSHTVFLLSPAHSGGKRAQWLLDPNASFPLALRLRRDGIPVGEAMSFMSGLYFRGKLAYANAFQQAPRQRSGVLVIGTRCPAHGEFVLTITAATLRPIQLTFQHMAAATELKRVLDDTIPFDMYLDDTHGSPAHRKHLTYYFAEQIRSELAS